MSDFTSTSNHVVPPHAVIIHPPLIQMPKTLIYLDLHLSMKMMNGFPRGKVRCIVTSLILIKNFGISLKMVLIFQ